MTALKRSTEQDPLLGQCRSPLPQHLVTTGGSFLHGVPDHMASPYQTKTRRLLPILTEGWNSRHSSSKSGSTWWKRIIRKLKHPLLSQGFGPACRRHQGLRTSLDSSELVPSLCSRNQHATTTTHGTWVQHIWNNNPPVTNRWLSSVDRGTQRIH